MPANHGARAPKLHHRQTIIGHGGRTIERIVVKGLVVDQAFKDITRDHRHVWELLHQVYGVGYGARSVGIGIVVRSPEVHTRRLLSG